MAVAVGQSSNRPLQERAFAPGLLLMACSVALTLLFFTLSSDLVESFPLLYLLPWVLALGVVLITPSLILLYRGKLKFYDPLVFATWVYFFPSFVIGGLTLASGWSQPYYLTYVQDAEYNLPYTVVLIMLGFAGLAAGYFSPLGSKPGAVLARYLPTRDFDTPVFLVPGLFLLILGTLNTVFAFFLGFFGYQKLETIESYGGIVFLITLFWLQGSFILLFFLFRRGKVDLTSLMVGLLLFATMVGRALFSGSRAALLQAFLIVILAFLLAGKKLNFRRAMAAGIILPSCVIVGMIYGSTFRDVKGTESRVSVGEYTESVFETFDEVGRWDLAASLEFALTGLAARLDTLSTVAVVVSSYEQLQPYEESYGLDNNIWKDITTFFIPRIIWNDKPVASEPRKYSDLYFNYGDNSFAITPMADLLRNYGPIGVPIGMFIFGIIIRFIYRSLIEDQPRTMWRASLYFMLLLAISYEGFYGLLIPYLFKVGVTAIVGIVIVNLVARSLGYRKTANPV